MNEEERAILRDMFHAVRQFGQDPRADLRYPDMQEVAMSVEEFIEAVLKEAPELRFKGVSPEDIVKGLGPEARAKLRRLLGDEHTEARAPGKGRRRPAPAKRKR